MAIYCKLNTLRDVLFVMFAVMWVITRMTIYPLWLVMCSINRFNNRIPTTQFLLQINSSSSTLYRIQTRLTIRHVATGAPNLLFPHPQKSDKLHSINCHFPIGLCLVM